VTNVGRSPALNVAMLKPDGTVGRTWHRLEPGGIEPADVDPCVLTDDDQAAKFRFEYSDGIGNRYRVEHYFHFEDSSKNTYRAVLRDDTGGWLPLADS
jgi:hypothetical protein